jgi:hypothetical protein
MLLPPSFSIQLWCCWLLLSLSSSDAAASFFLYPAQMRPFVRCNLFLHYCSFDQAIVPIFKHNVASVFMLIIL